jgi:hypothetical protein
MTAEARLEALRGFTVEYGQHTIRAMSLREDVQRLNAADQNAPAREQGSEAGLEEPRPLT